MASAHRIRPGDPRSGCRAPGPAAAHHRRARGRAGPWRRGRDDAGRHPQSAGRAGTARHQRRCRGCRGFRHGLAAPDLAGRGGAGRLGGSLPGRQRRAHPGRRLPAHPQPGASGAGRGRPLDRARRDHLRGGAELSGCLPRLPQLGRRGHRAPALVDHRHRVRARRAGPGLVHGGGALGRCPGPGPRSRAGAGSLPPAHLDPGRPVRGAARRRRHLASRPDQLHRPGGADRRTHPGRQPPGRAGPGVGHPGSHPADGSRCHRPRRHPAHELPASVVAAAAGAPLFILLARRGRLSGVGT